MPQLAEGGIDTLYLLNSSDLHSLHVPDAPEEIQLGDYQALAPTIAWVSYRIYANITFHPNTTR